MSNKKVVLLVGGVGGAKLAYGLAQILPPDDLTIIVNTGDDFWHYGLRICPDLDTVMYTLSGWVETSQGWGVKDDSTRMLDMLREYGDSPWFRLGDRDLATHLLRTRLLREGHTLTAIVNRLTSSLHIGCKLLPMTDSEMATMVNTVEQGELPFQEYFVKHRWQLVVKSLRFDGAETAQMTPQVKDAITQADAIIVGPSNPWLSIDPILAVPGLRELIAEQDVPCVAVTPIVEGDALKGPAAKLMREWGYDVRAETVAAHYGDVINSFIYDQRDTNFQPTLLPESIRRYVAFDTVMTTDAKRVALAKNVLTLTEVQQ